MNNLDYGVVGNCKSAALVSRTGSIDWFCLPNFDSPSVFASLLDTERGGRFAILPVGECEVDQAYIPRTNVLTTHFHGPEFAFEVTDFMPRYRNERNGFHCPPDLIRIIRPIFGAPRVRIVYEPRPGYAQHETRTTIEKDFIKSATAGRPYESVYLYTELDKEAVVAGEPVLIPQGGAFLLLSYNQKVKQPTFEFVDLEFERTKVYWLNWTTRMTHYERFNDQIQRSALALKLLCYQKTGAILAAATTSLPESIGEVRNWDYRYCWIRDASMTIKVLTSIGHVNEAHRFLNFILDIVPYKDERIQIMYGINGERKLKEKILPWLEGYEGSKPVRIGNDAYTQKQNDIYGVLIDVIYQSLVMFRTTLDGQEDLWTVVRTLVRNVRRHWRQPDKGIWEIRSEKKHFTFSKILCWIAMDRAVKIAEIFEKPSYAAEWAVTRDKIEKDIRKHGWHEGVQAFTQSYGDENLDAANLLMEHYGFIEADDPKYVSTVERTREQLSRNGLMYRYRNADDFGLPSSSFTICSFWMITSLYRIGREQQAIAMFEDIIQHANHLGLFSEDMDFVTRRLLGNFPQAYSHLALIDAAVTLNGGSYAHEDI